MDGVKNARRLILLMSYSAATCSAPKLYEPCMRRTIS